MNNKNKALLLSGITSLVLLSGCGNTDNKEEAIDNKSDIHYSNMVTSFEPGTHIINYYDYFDNADKEYYFMVQSDGIYHTNIPTYEGYELFSVEPINELIGHGSRTFGMMYTFINTKTVEATGVYNYEKNTYEFYEPGVVVQEKVLN